MKLASRALMGASMIYSAGAGLSAGLLVGRIVSRFIDPITTGFMMGFYMAAFATVASELPRVVQELRRDIAELRRRITLLVGLLIAACVAFGVVALKLYTEYEYVGLLISVGLSAFSIWFGWQSGKATREEIREGFREIGAKLDLIAELLAGKRRKKEPQ